MATGLPTDHDVEGAQGGLLRNDTVFTYAWSGCSVTVKDRKTKQPRRILDQASGVAQSGACPSVQAVRSDGRAERSH